MLYWVSSLLLAIPFHTHSGKTYFYWSQRSFSNPSFGSPLKRKGFFMVVPSSGTRGSRSLQPWRPQIRKMAKLVFPEASLLCTAWLYWKEAQAEQIWAQMMLSTDVTLTLHTASAACACKDARAGHSKIPQGEGNAPGIFKPQLLHHLYSRERP